MSTFFNLKFFIHLIFYKDTTANTERESNNLEKLRASIFENDIKRKMQPERSDRMPNQDLSNIRPEERHPKNPIEELKPIIGDVKDTTKEKIEEAGKAIRKEK